MTKRTKRTTWRKLDTAAGSRTQILPTNEIYFSQFSINETFTDGSSVSDLTDKLATGEISADEIPHIRVVLDRNRWYALDNRRLRAFKDALINSITVIICHLEDEAIHDEFMKKKNNRSSNENEGGQVRRDHFNPFPTDHFEQGIFVYTKRVLLWNPAQLGQEFIDLDEEPHLLLSSLYESFLDTTWGRRIKREQYFKKFLPLILEETRVILYEALQRSRKDPNSGYEVRLLKTSFSNNPQNPSSFNLKKPHAYKDTITTGDIFLFTSVVDPSIQFLAMGAHLDPDLYPDEFMVKAIPDRTWIELNPKLFSRDSLWKITYLDSLITLLRMYDVCTAMPKTIFDGQLVNGDLSYPTEAIVNSAMLITEAPEEELPELTALNSPQKEAVTHFLSKDAGIQLVQGPPGTGKTTTINALLQILYKRNERTLVSAPSNKAVQILIQRFLQTHVINQPIVFCGVEEKLPDDPAMYDIFLHAIGKEILKKIDTVQKSIYELSEKEINADKKQNLIETIQSNLKYIFSKLDFYKIKIPLGQSIELRLRSHTTILGGDTTQLTLSLLFRDIVKLQKALKDSMSDFTKEGFEKQILNNSILVFCTLSVAGRTAMKNMNPVTNLIVDEAGQAVEPETLIPLFYSPHRMLLIGDTKQLPAVVKSPLAKNKKFDRSLLDRLLEDCKQPYDMLLIQHRMHPAISAWPSAQFYRGLLQNHITIQEETHILPALLNAPPFLHPCAFINVEGRETSGELTHMSFANRAEALLIRDLLFYLHSLGVDIEKNVGIITFYKGQEALLKQELEAHFPYARVKTVDGFQGGEEDIIIISCTRAHSNTIGFLKDFRRLNVAVTRARYSLIVVGHAATLQQGESDIAELIQHYRRHDHFFEENAVSRILNARSARPQPPLVRVLSPPVAAASMTFSNTGTPFNHANFPALPSSARSTRPMRPVRPVLPPTASTASRPVLRPRLSLSARPRLPTVRPRPFYGPS